MPKILHTFEVRPSGKVNSVRTRAPGVGEIGLEFRPGTVHQPAVAAGVSEENSSVGNQKNRAVRSERGRRDDRSSYTRFGDHFSGRRDGVETASASDEDGAVGGQHRGGGIVVVQVYIPFFRAEGIERI